MCGELIRLRAKIENLERELDEKDRELEQVHNSGVLFCQDCVHCGPIEMDTSCECECSGDLIWAEKEPCSNFRSKLRAKVCNLIDERRAMQPCIGALAALLEAAKQGKPTDRYLSSAERVLEWYRWKYPLEFVALGREIDR